MPRAGPDHTHPIRRAMHHPAHEPKPNNKLSSDGQTTQLGGFNKRSTQCREEPKKGKVDGRRGDHAPIIDRPEHQLRRLIG